MNLCGTMVIGQSGGPTMVINQSLVGAIIEARSHGEITGILGAKHGIRGIMNEDFLDLSQQPDLRVLEQVATTPAAALGSVRMKPTKADCQRVFEVFHKHDVRFFFYIGGNDSAETANIISKMAKDADYDLCTIHIPKTIDNDLKVTDHCPGYPSAARFVAQAFMGDNQDNRALGGIKINVVMGRHAGFLTAAAALARQNTNDGPHLIYLPERVFDVAQFQQDVRKCYKRLGRCIIAVSEGIADAEGNPISAGKEVDSHGNIQLSGTGALGDALSILVKQEFEQDEKNIRVRADTFGYLQRSFPDTVSEVDANEARMVGCFAVQHAVQGSSASIALRRNTDAKEYSSHCITTTLASVARDSICMPDTFIASNNHDITEAFLDYVLPLVGDLPVMQSLSDSLAA
ncbi:MAG: 6-phosphofructokinase [Mariprofundales bacterium]